MAISIEARNAADEMTSLSVYIKNRQKGINTRVSLKTKIPTKEWSKELQLPKKITDERPVKCLNGMSYALLGNKLMKLKKELLSMEECDNFTVSTVKDMVTRIMNEEYIAEKKESENINQPQPVLLIEWIREFIRQCETGERLKQKSTKRIKYNTLKAWKLTLHYLENYEKESHKRLGFEDVSMDFFDDWIRWLVKKDFSPNTIAGRVKQLKIFLHAAKDMKMPVNSAFESSRFSAAWVDVENVYLTEERVDQMYNFDLMNDEELEKCLKRFKGAERKELENEVQNKISRDALQRAKDTFIVGCITGQRFSDYSRITKSMVVTLRDGNEYLRISQVKTDKEVFLPLDPRIVTILDRWGGKVPASSDVKVNKHIKIVAHLLGWTENAGLTERKGSMEYASNKKFYEAVKTHTARRTFATNAYKRGVSLASIMAVTGHSSEQMLRKYLKLDNKERAILAAAEFAKVAG